ncbi:type II toxin-antitoxin system VapC family toxin [Rhizobium sp. TRM95796]|uniref:type II toxin-antitoxin system VapC family toxin n=1 Tax=Rhizobium sp. TRM95796 TaxID=2979862 RepID=UPI0021E8D5A7|nr:type II toxin-antitoxin system VapC family toxin [Rhizobium sp. TRM95796]MCV3765910.1 type II toxin-antitoxin system VapC family toxin [Rhizobium sp. TRM95796]
MMRYLLDTNVISDAIRNPKGIASEALERHAQEEIGTSIVVKGELLFGLRGNPGFRKKAALEALLGAIVVWPLDEATASHYAEIRHALRQGQNIGPNDLWIAAHALALDAVLVTDNEREFSRVPGLKLENWVR